MQVQPQREGVAVDAPARVTLRRAREPYRAVEREFLPDPVVRAVEVRAAARGLLRL
jgi:hypothetical protein